MLQKILLSFLHFCTETDYDFLIIQYGTSVMNEEIGKYSGALASFELLSNGSNLLVQFLSDILQAENGFMITYRFVGRYKIS